jgi:RNA polymerase sigma-70 factor (ECF subfamily)
LFDYNFNFHITTGTNLENIIQGCIAAKRHSQKEFYQIFYGYAMAICLRYCPETEDALEVVNDGFLKVFKNLPVFTPRFNNYEASLKGWIKVIMINTSIDHYRKVSKSYFITPIQDDHFEMGKTEETAIDKMTYNEILKLVDQLSPVYRAVFNLFVIDGFSHEEIANQLNIAVGTSKSNLSKAKANIQKMLKESKIYNEPKAV